MSRIGKKPIKIPNGVEIKIADDLITIKGPKGELTLKLHPLVKVAKQEDEILVTVSNPEEKNGKALWGLFNRLINNMVIGTTKEFQKKLEVIGVGFKVNLQGQKLVLNVGFSHPVEYILPKGIGGTVEKNVITITGIDKQLVGEVAAQIRRIKKPEPYKGKGIRYIDEVVKKKVGKAAAKSSS
ncbi:MAG: 50S ribosomal protein L6 [Candidatus Parcubacteria bacterium]|nr:50S ribosomal protein L6 [Candidatus Parcubacteria bacterium]